MAVFSLAGAAGVPSALASVAALRSQAANAKVEVRVADGDRRSTEHHCCRKAGEQRNSMTCIILNISRWPPGLEVES